MDEYRCIYIGALQFAIQNIFESRKDMNFGNFQLTVRPGPGP